MSEDWLKLIPAPLLSQSISLVPYGINENAWPIGAASSILAAFGGSSYAILGGDIYLESPNGFIPAHENWHSDISLGEPWLTYVHRTHAETGQYLLGLGKASDKWFTIVAVSEPSASQLVAINAC